jgi:hypothetical protein
MRQLWGVITFIILSVSYMLAPNFASAAPLRLGAPYAVVRATFVNVEEFHKARRRTLDVRDPHFAGVVWRKAHFDFDATDHLASVTLSTTGDSFAHIQKLMADALAQADAAPLGQGGLAQDLEGDVQIRICEATDGVITVTFARTAI